MAHLVRDLEHLERWPSDERLRALERIIPLDVVQQILRQTGHAARHYARLPAWFMTFFVVALGLFCKDCYRQVFKWLQRFRPGATPGRGTLADARQGLGIAPLRLLARRVVRLLGSPDTPGAFYKSLRLMALDGFVLDLPDTPANERAFGRPQSGRSPGAFPQARVLALCATGSHVLYRWQIKPCRRGEVSMTPTLLRHLEPDMLLLWDRNFFSYHNLRQVLARGAHLLARVKRHLVLPRRQVLPDGSYLSKVYPSARDRQHDRDGLVVRVIEYTLDDPARGDGGQVHRLVTTLLSAQEHPAEELIALYHERWEEESTIDEVKTHQKERPVLRSQTPAGVVQEIEGLLLAHYVIRVLLHEAAAQKEIEPRRLSFVGALKVLRCRLPEVPADEAGRQRWWEALLAEVGEEVLPPRRDRVNPRVIKRKMSKWKKKRPHHRQHPQPSKPFRESIVIT
jgi:Insertion element 4 transposase N-terminal/Transposase DDE domain